MARSVMPEPRTHARQLVGCLDRLGRADHPSAVSRCVRQRTAATARAAGRWSIRRSQSRALSGHQGAPTRAANSCTPSSKSRYTGPWMWSDGSSRAKPVVLAHGEKRCGHSSSTEHDGHRLFEVRPARIGERPDGTGRVDDVGVAEQHELRRSPARASRHGPGPPARGACGRDPASTGSASAELRPSARQTSAVQPEVPPDVAPHDVAPPLLPPTAVHDGRQRLVLYPYVLSLCGKSVDHITRSTPMRSTSSSPSGSTMNDAHMWLSQ